MDGLLGLILLTQVTSTTYDHAQSNQHAQDFIRISRLAQGVSTNVDQEIICSKYFATASGNWEITCSK